MHQTINRKQFISTIIFYIAAVLVWTFIFWNNPYLKNVLWDIHIIFTSTLLSYFIIRVLFSTPVMEFLKVFIRTLFRVWLLIFITFAIAHSMDRVGILLSLTFIFGYIEGLFDINKWLETGNSFFRFPADISTNKYNHALATIQVMSIIHLLCAVVVLLFYLFF